MNRKDWLPVIIIVALFLAYPVIDRKIVAKWFPAPERPAAAEARRRGIQVYYPKCGEKTFMDFHQTTN